LITLLGRQSDNADGTIVRGVIVHLGVLATILLLYLVLAQIKCVVGPGGGGVARWDERATEER
jgi:hypothetical protein